MKKILWILVIFVAAGSSTAAASCEKMNQWVDEKVASDNCLERMSGLMVGGVRNLTLSPVELLYHPWHELVSEQNFKTGWIKGPVDGLVGASEYVLTGTWNILTAWFPGNRGTAVEEHKNCFHS